MMSHARAHPPHTPPHGRETPGGGGVGVRDVPDKDLAIPVSARELLDLQALKIEPASYTARRLLRHWRCSRPDTTPDVLRLTLWAAGREIAQLRAEVERLKVGP